MSHYLQVNNEANESYSDSLLGTIESGSSYTMDAGSYRFALGESDRTPYVPFELTGTRYYIPRLPQTSYPRWFVAQGSYVTTAGGKNLGSAYIVFAQDSAGAALERRRRAGHPARPGTAADSNRFRRVRGERRR